MFDDEITNSESNSEDLGLVHLVAMGQGQRAYPVNGVKRTTRDILADFFGAGDEDFDAIDFCRSHRVTQVNRGELRTAEDLDRVLPKDAVITVYSQAVGEGGVKAALV